VVNAPRTIDDVIRVLYTSISGPAGAARDWVLNDSIYLPNAAIAVVRHRPDGPPDVELLTPSEYRRTREPFLLEHGFYESERSRQVTVHGAFAHVVSEYESRWRPDEEPFETGANVLQLVETPAGWRILAIAWTAGVAASHIPAAALAR
jgi:hypothetical protein